MPQEFHVLQCFSCQTFQVHQVKKVLKWMCKLCGEKQSVIKVYGRGSGKDCRGHVQKLNTLRGETDDQRDSLLITGQYDITSGLADQLIDAEVKFSSLVPVQGHSNRWSQYLEHHLETSTCVPQQQNCDDGDDDDEHVTTDLQLFKSLKRQKQKSKRSHPYPAKFNINSKQCYTKQPSNRGSSVDWRSLSHLGAPEPTNSQSVNAPWNTGNQSVNAPWNTGNQSVNAPWNTGNQSVNAPWNTRNQSVNAPWNTGNQSVNVLMHTNNQSVNVTRHTSNQALSISWDPNNQSADETNTNLSKTSERQLTINNSTNSVSSNKYQRHIPSKSKPSSFGVTIPSSTSKWGQFLFASVDNLSSSDDDGDVNATSMILTKPGNVCPLGVPSGVFSVPNNRVKCESGADYEAKNMPWKWDMYSSKIELPILDREKVDNQNSRLPEISSFHSIGDVQINCSAQDMNYRKNDNFKENLLFGSHDCDNASSSTCLESKSQTNIKNTTIHARQKNSSSSCVSGVHTMFQIEEEEVDFDL